MKYLLKWENGDETWETKKKTTKVCPPALLSEYNERTKEALAEALAVRFFSLSTIFFISFDRLYFEMFWSSGRSDSFA